MAHLPDRTYIVVLHAESAARFANGEEYLVRELRTPHGTAAMILRTDFEDEGVGDLVPRCLWFEIAGSAPTPTPPSKTSDGSGANFGPIIATAVNAHVGDVRPVMAFEVTPGLKEREFFQNFIRKDSRIPQAMRIIPWGVVMLRRANCASSTVHYCPTARYPDLERRRPRRTDHARRDRTARPISNGSVRGRAP
jgi:hypothetical protein